MNQEQRSRATIDGAVATSRCGIIDSIADPVLYLDDQEVLELANTAFTDTFGYADLSHGTIRLETVFDAPESCGAIEALIEQARRGEQATCEIALPTVQGRRRGFFIRCDRDTQNDTAHFVIHFRDVTEERRLRERLALLEYRDRRTGLPNRASLDIVLDKEFSRVERSETDEMLAILFISLENIARISQTYGHEIGDILLENSGIRIKESIVSELLRDSDYVFSDSHDAHEVFPVGEPEQIDEEHLLFRFDGREFTAVLTGIHHETDAAVVAMRIARSVSLPYRDKFGAEIYIACHIGIAVFPNDGGDRETVVNHAASAMHEAKRLGEEFLLFNPTLHQRALERMRLGGSIYHAFIESQFEMYYQPIVDYTGEILGAEALIRWHHPERGLVPPSEFIPLAEEKGIIVNIGKWALYHVADRLSRWPDDIYVSINTSPLEMAHADILDTVSRVLSREPAIDPRRLKIEITERDAMKNPEETIRRMQVLTDRGVEILIDDFGVGNSSLSYLKRLPAGTLKIDRSFVEQITEDDAERDFLESIIDLAYSRKKHVVVEGVETEQQAAIIRQMKPVKFQGYYFSRPVPADEFERLVRERRRLPIV